MEKTNFVASLSLLFLFFLLVTFKISHLANALKY